MKRFLTLLIAVSALLSASAQRVTVAFYNVENLYDTVPSLFYDDAYYTPCGKYHWNDARYSHKISDVARVVGDIRADLFGLAEVENVSVVRDLVHSLGESYNYVHKTSGDSRGMDMALLYRGDKFEVIDAQLAQSGTAREFLYVRGRLFDDTLSIVVCHMPSMYNKSAVRSRAYDCLSELIESLSDKNPDDVLLVMGDMNAVPESRYVRGLGFEPLFGDFTSRGWGSYCYNGRWSLLDNIFYRVPRGQGFCFKRSGIFIQPYMMTVRNGQNVPHRCFERGAYEGGISDHLPVYAVFDVSDVQ